MAGTKHDQGKSRMDLIDMETLLQIGEVLRAGAAVHGEHNWRQGLKVSRNVGAAMRHIAKFLNGQDIDPDHGTPHLIHAMVDLMFAYATVRDLPVEWDDRFRWSDQNLDSIYNGPDKDVAPSVRVQIAGFWGRSLDEVYSLANKGGITGIFEHEFHPDVDMWRLRVWKA